MSSTFPNFTTVSAIFCCAVCEDSVDLIVLPGGDLAYECVSPTCGKTVHVDCPEGLKIRESIELGYQLGLHHGARLGAREGIRVYREGHRWDRPQLVEVR